MKNLFNDISQEERNRILEMHQSATRKNYLSEQAAPAPVPVPTGPTGGTNAPQTPSDPIITLMSGITNADTFSTTPITDTTSDLIRFFKVTPVKAPINGEAPNPEATRTQVAIQVFIRMADKYYVSRKMSPKGGYSLSTLFGNNPIVTQLTTQQGVNPAKFTKTGLDNAYYNYLTEKLKKVRT